MKNLLTGAALMLLALSVQAQDSRPICQVQEPKAPPTPWHGVAAYPATALVRNGRVTMVEIRSLKGGVDRKAQRILIQAIEQSLRSASCQPGDHEFEQRFEFDLRESSPTAGG